MKMPKYYKVLDKHGFSFHGGEMRYNLPDKKGNGEYGFGMNTLGRNDPVTGCPVALEMCRVGLHITCKPWKWMSEAQSPDDIRVFEVHYWIEDGVLTDLTSDKICVRTVNLVREVPRWKVWMWKMVYPHLPRFIQS